MALLRMDIIVVTGAMDLLITLGMDLVMGATDLGMAVIITLVTITLDIMQDIIDHLTVIH